MATKFRVEADFAVHGKDWTPNPTHIAYERDEETGEIRRVEVVGAPAILDARQEAYEFDDRPTAEACLAAIKARSGAALDASRIIPVDR